MNDEFTVAGNITISRPKSYLWKPQPDITTYELALCVPIFHVSGNAYHWHEAGDMVDALPAEAKRHWIEYDPNARLADAMLAQIP